MRKASFDTGRGKIVYWVSDTADATRPWVVFLPGLTADRRLFAPQIEHFESRANCLAWDAPAHGESRPFPLDFSLPDLARWLGEIMKAEGVSAPVLVGQSMGGYVAQVFDVLFPGARLRHRVGGLRAARPRLLQAVGVGLSALCDAHVLPVPLGDA